MKVLIVNTVPFNKNGISTVIMNYYDVLKNIPNIHFDFLSISNIDNYFEKQISEDSQIFKLSCRKNNPLKYCFNLYRILKKNNYDIIHVHGNSSLLSLELFTAKIVNVPVRIAHSHNTTCDFKILNKLLKPIFFCSYTHGIACGKEAGQWMFGKHHFMILENGIDLNRFSYNQFKDNKLKETLSLENKIVIGHVGGFIPQKNHTILIDIFSKLLLKNNDYHLLLIGDGPLKNDIEKKCVELKIINSVTFLGNKQDVYNYYNVMDVFVLPSLFEGLPVVLIEAQANGLHCIVSDAVSFEAKLSDLIEFVSKEQYISSIYKINTSYDQELREENSKNAILQLREKGFDVQTNAQKLLNFYMSCLS